MSKQSATERLLIAAQKTSNSPDKSSKKQLSHLDDFLSNRIDWQKTVDHSFSDIPRIEGTEEDFEELFQKMCLQSDYFVKIVTEMEQNVSQHTIVQKYKELNKVNQD